MACFIRIFRVLHTVQSSVFKVRLRCFVLNSNSFILPYRFCFVNNFFHFLFSLSADPCTGLSPCWIYNISCSTNNVKGICSIFSNNFYRY
ncbi:hypothetical protein CLOSTHATH_02978 [Hungatella hathewayi DSM 13479]|uniref:Uncharacterized protein n=1 Tax=Hungatella hathewayi DSM 13479 TaxID=566550 RepID=D3AH91_9FIRM|nr:hypothetical protein CLOSTHATH_02978 [Hungatella hathewayi DSM 13479]